MALKEKKYSDKSFSVIIQGVHSYIHSLFVVKSIFFYFHRSAQNVGQNVKPLIQLIKASAKYVCTYVAQKSRRGILKNQLRRSG
jgi:hypothetical protein